MVYSTCPMNPVENEAVVAEVLRRCGGSVELLDVSSELPELVRRPGLKKWKVRDKGLWLASFEDGPVYRRSVIIPSMFPSEQSSKDSHITHDGAQDVIDTNGSEIGKEGTDSFSMNHQDVSNVEQESNSTKMESYATLADVNEASCEMKEISNRSASEENLVVDFKMEISTCPLERCMRLLPHDQNSGAFFIAVLQKLSHVQEKHTSRSNNGTHKVPAKKVENFEDEQKSEIKSSEDVPHQDHHIVAETASNANLINEKLPAMETKDGVASYCKDVLSQENGIEEVETCDNEESGHEGPKGAKGKLQLQGKWRGVDPVIFFRDETTIDSIRSFYGISESFPLDGHLVTRNSDANHVKRIYYISKSVHDILQLNFQVGQRLKITSLGLKIFERQTSKDGSPCAFRISSEGLPLLLPYISKQVLFASLVDFQHLLQYRVIKFADFVDADFGEKASRLMSGCCVVVLNEGNQTTDNILVDASTIAIICWKGKTNLSIMVSQLDSQELLERLSARFGTERVDLSAKDVNASTETDAMNVSEDAELIEGFDAADLETEQNMEEKILE